MIRLERRDVYDLLGYLGDPDWPPPSLALLNDALSAVGVEYFAPYASWGGM